MSHYAILRNKFWVVKLNKIMGTKRIWTIEEIDVDGEVGHRQSMMSFDDDTGELVRPDERLGTAGRNEWDRVIALLSDVSGEDFSHIINGVALMDHCKDMQEGRPHRLRGRGSHGE